MKRISAALAACLALCSPLVARAQGDDAKKPDEEKKADDAPKDAPKPAPVKTDEAKAEPAKEEPKTENKLYRLEGYVNLGIGARSVPRAVPRDRLTYGLRSSLAGLIVRGEPFDRFSYVVHFGLNPNALLLVSDVKLVDQRGDGSSYDVSTNEREVTVIPVEEVSISYALTSWWSVKGGHFYMPFSPAASVLVTSQMFPSRPEPTRVFMIGADQGLATTASFFDERISLSLGAFNGSSLELGIPGTTSVGPVMLAMIDAQPLGKMPDTEGDPKKGPFRFALGMGSLYRAGRLYESEGYEATRFREVRLDAAARVAFRGLFVQAELLRRQQRDDLSGRPATATGAYVQGSFFQPIPGTRVALAPLGRYGVAISDQDFFPRKTIEIEAGVAFYPRADLDDPNKLRFILQYDGEQRLPENEIAHGGVLHAQLRW